MHNPQAIIQAALRTEKGARLEPHRQYLFHVALDANKLQIKQAVEELFKVKVTAVRTMHQHGKPRRLRLQLGRRPDWKKAIVTLAEGQKIAIAENP